ncbi:MAG: hypothetical protein QXT43_02345 [Candidatus Micrarchaeaceae archaeon]
MARSERSDFDRYLDYRAKHGGWISLRAIYWAIYILVIGGLLVVYGKSATPISWTLFWGTALILLSVMIIIYGAAESLHNKLMRKHA